MAPRSLDEFERSLLNEEVEIPPNLALEVLKRFGGDELSALALSAVGTAAVGAVPLGFLPAQLSKLVLTCAGPATEKAGLNARYQLRELRRWGRTPKDARRAYWHYFVRALKDGEFRQTLWDDLTMHDPLYGLFMYCGLNVVPRVAPGLWEDLGWFGPVLTGAASFAAALALVVCKETLKPEFQYWRFRRGLLKQGFEDESYVEARFYIGADQNPMDVLEIMASEFGLADPEHWDYRDCYFDHSVPGWNGRRPSLRLRHRVEVDDPSNFWKTAQIVMRKGCDMSKRERRSHRVYVDRKDKIYLCLRIPEGMPESPDGIQGSGGEAFAKLYAGGDGRCIQFRRTHIHNDELLVSVDNVHEDRPLFLVEIKVRSDVELLKHAVRYCMVSFPVIPTLHGKRHLVDRFGETVFSAQNS